MNTWLKACAWIGVGAIAIGAGVGIAALTSGDDPAIVACETVLTAQLKSPKTYERHEAKIIGSAVDITYDAVNAFNAPIRNQKRCSFKLTEDNHFKLSSADGSSALNALTAEMNDLDKSKVTPEIVQQYRERLAELVGKGMNDIISSAAEDEMLSGFDWYPIPANKTKLTQ